MRTISGTVRTKEEAETARRRLQAMGIEGDRILFKEVREAGGGAPSIFVTVKVAPEQVEAASDILKGDGPQAGRPAQEPPETEPRVEAAPAVQRPYEQAAIDTAPPSPPVLTVSDRSSPVARAESPAPAPRERGASARDPRPAPSRPGRAVAIALLLAGLGFAIGAALGIVF